MKAFVALAFAAALAAAWPAHAQPQGRPQRQQGVQPQRQQGVQPQRQQGVQPQKAGNERQEFRRERMDRGDHMERRERFSREERDKLRQDLLDANRDMKGRR
ncbi:MAG TPA: hypothetical protein VF876_11295 [Burkholderiales bacterium]